MNGRHWITRLKDVPRKLCAGPQQATQPVAARAIDCMELEDRTLLSATPIGGEVLINTVTANAQATHPENVQAVASDADGDTVVVWTSDAEDGDAGGIYAQRYDSDGNAQGSAFQVNTTATGDQRNAAVAMDDNGNFVVTWSSNGQDGDGWGVYAQRYNASGVAQGGEFLVNTSDTAGNQQYSTVALDGSGNFVIAWSTGVGSNSGIRAQRYDSAGAAQGAQIQVNTNTTDDQIHASIAMHSSGSFVATWTSANQDGGGMGIYAQRFNADGTYAGGEFLVNTTTLGDQQFSRVAMDSSGLFVVVWQSNGQDGDGWGVYARAFDASGTAVSGEVQVNTTTTNDQTYASVDIDADGNVIVTWQSNLQDGGGWGVYARRYDASMATIDAEFRVNQTTSGDQQYASLAAEDNGDFVVVWSGAGAGDASGVFSRRYSVNTAPALDATRTPVLNAMNEDAGAPSGAVGTLVSSLVDFASPAGQVDNVTDPDTGAQLGIAVTAADTSNGTWWYSTDNGSNWIALGSVANNNARLLAADANTRLYFQPNANYNGTQASAITFRAWDRRSGTNGGTADTSTNGGSSAFSTATDTASLTVNAVNDAPVNTVPAAQSTNEDTTLVFSSGNGNQISINDADAGGSSVRVTLTGTNGTITLNGTAGLSFTTGDGTGDATMTFTGSRTNINTALNGLGFSPTLNYSGAASVQVVTNDQGNTGSGGAGSNTDTVNITVNAVNDAPVNSVPAAQATNENTALVFSSGGGNPISIADVDAGGGLLQMTLTATNGTLTLNGTTGLSFTTGDGTADATLVFTGTLANINAALNGLAFAPTSGFSGAASVQITSHDQGNSGSGGGLSDTDTVNITVAAVNDAPVNSVPGAQAINEDTTLVFSSGGGNQISINDPDAGTNPIRVTLTTTNCTLTLNGTAGLSFTTGDGTSDGTMAFTGTLANINAALNGLAFTPALNFNGAASVQIVTNDQGNTGSGGAQSDTDTVSITVNAVNDAPVNTVPGAQSTNEDTALVFSSGSGNQISINDIDAGASPVHVTLTATNGTLTLSGIAGLSFTTGDGTGDGTMTFTGTQASINTALNGLSFTPALNFSGAASVQIITNDQGNTGSGGAGSDTDTVNITVNSVNDAPLNTVPGAQATTEDTPLIFSTAGGNAISLGDADAGGNPVQATLTAVGGTLTLAGTAGLTFTTGDGTADATLVFSGTLANINAALDGMVLTPTLNFTGAASVQITTNDLGNTGGGGALTDNDTVAIAVGAVNDAPSLTTPGPQATTENNPVIFSAAGGNQIAISDVDAGSGALQVTLTVTNGSLTLNGIAGLSFSTGDGTADAAMVFTGTLADINAALDGLSFTPTLDYNGPATLAIDVDDQGNTGSGGPLGDTATVAIVVGSVNTPPVNSVPGPQSVNEDTSLVFSAAGGNQITISDVDASGSPVQVTLTATQGTLTLASTSGLTFTSGDGANDGTMTFAGTLADINAALNGLSFSPVPNYNGAASLQIVTDDQGNTGSGGPRSDTDTVNITVNAVNDAPLNTVPGPQATNDDLPLVFSAAAGNQILISDLDAAPGLLQVTLAATNGTFSLSGTAGLAFTTGDGSADGSMVFTGTLADINAALDGLVFTATFNFTGTATLALTTSDLGNTGSGGPLADSNTISIAVTAINEAPLNTVPVGQTINEDTTLTFSTAGGNAISISDSDANPGQVEVTLAATNGTLTLNGTAGLMFTTGDGTADATLVFTGTLANINAALDGLLFAPTLDFNGAASVQITTNDLGNTGSGGPLSDTDTVAITVNSINDAPLIAGPVTQSTPEDTALIFSTATGNAIAITDVDAGGGLLQLMLTATQGTLTLASLAGLTFDAGDGTDDATLQVRGTLADINAALDGLRYSPDANYFGPAQVQIDVSDQGNSGAGGTLVDAHVIAIDVVSQNDAPTVSVPGGQSLGITTLVFSAAGGNAIVVGDLEAAATPIEVTLTATDGTLTLASTSGLTFVSGTGAGDTQLIVLGTAADINAALNGLVFQWDAIGDAPALLVSVNDLGTSGQGGALATSANIAIAAPPLIPPPSTDTDADADADSDSENDVTPGGLVPGGGDSPDTRDRRTDGSRADRRRPDRAAPPVAVSLVPSVSLVVAGGESAEPSFASSLEASAQRLAGLAKAAVRNAQRQAMLDANLLWGQLDALAEQLTGDDSLGQYTVGAAAGVSVALSAGYVAWCLRSGALLASAISSLPMWRSFDPLPVLEFWEKKEGGRTRRRVEDEEESEQPLEELVQTLV